MRLQEKHNVRTLSLNPDTLIGGLPRLQWLHRLLVFCLAISFFPLIPFVAFFGLLLDAVRSRDPYDLGWSFRNVYMSSLHSSGTLGLYGLGWSFRKIYMVSFCSSGNLVHNDLVGHACKRCMLSTAASRVLVRILSCQRYTLFSVSIEHFSTAHSVHTKISSCTAFHLHPTWPWFQRVRACALRLTCCCKPRAQPCRGCCTTPENRA